MEKNEIEAWSNRRSIEDRRKSQDPDYKGPERRSGEDRRTVKDRRKFSRYLI